MQSSPDIQLLIEEHGSRGTWNMAADEFLLLRALETGQAAVRIYRWDDPTVSLGYFQDSTGFRNSGRFTGLPAVRRLSGGGAILHDQEITYSLAVPPTFAAVPGATHYYESAHSGITYALREYGVTVVPRGNTHHSHSESFLCFSRGDRNDLLLQGVKIAGSAQRRRKGAVLQHGSILLRASQHALELPGISDLAPAFAPDDSIGKLLGRAIVSELLRLRGCEYQDRGQTDRTFAHRPDCFSPDDLRQIQELEHVRYRDIDQIRSQPVTERHS